MRSLENRFFDDFCISKILPWKQGGYEVSKSGDVCAA